MNALEVRELTKVYPEFTLDKVSFFVKQGHISGLIGRNGAGKSTKLKVIYVLLMQKEVSRYLEKIFLERRWLLNRR